ncbi:hypothetical protein J437_LFUL016321 [Ladona fulva]|uniref:Cytochrome c oxidase assembly factor 7 n=1 Tax=Ladona fulva TaxID=123851 RepID=A0A8K0KK11_LADFU|nr:hypothetical protein J437_LFUL016321 [Ladona fulva]
MDFDLKEEAEVKDFLEKLGIEYRFGCYNEGKPEVCHLLGDYLESVKKDYEKAAKVYKANCEEQKHAKSCYKFGTYTFLGKGNVKEDQLKAFDYFAKGCEYGNSDACLKAGLMCVTNSTKNKKEKDIKQGLKLLEQSCKGRNAFACFYVSGMYLSGVQGSSNAEELPKDMKMAHYYAEEACKLGSPHACANVSQMYRKGDGVPKDEMKADQFKKIALEMQEEVLKARQLNFQEGIPSVESPKN